MVLSLVSRGILGNLGVGKEVFGGKLIYGSEGF